MVYDRQTYSLHTVRRKLTLYHESGVDPLVGGLQLRNFHDLLRCLELRRLSLSSDGYVDAVQELLWWSLSWFVGDLPLGHNRAADVLTVEL